MVNCNFNALACLVEIIERLKLYCTGFGIFVLNVSNDRYPPFGRPHFLGIVIGNGFHSLDALRYDALH